MKKSIIGLAVFFLIATVASAWATPIPQYTQECFQSVMYEKQAAVKDCNIFYRDDMYMCEDDFYADKEMYWECVGELKEQAVLDVDERVSNPYPLLTLPCSYYNMVSWINFHECGAYAKMEYKACVKEATFNYWWDRRECSE